MKKIYTFITKLMLLMSSWVSAVGTTVQYEDLVRAHLEELAVRLSQATNEKRRKAESKVMKRCRPIIELLAEESAKAEDPQQCIESFMGTIESSSSKLPKPRQLDITQEVFIIFSDKFNEVGRNLALSSDESVNDLEFETNPSAPSLQWRYQYSAVVSRDSTKASVASSSTDPVPRQSILRSTTPGNRSTTPGNSQDRRVRWNPVSSTREITPRGTRSVTKYSLLDRLSNKLEEASRLESLRISSSSVSRRRQLREQVVELEEQCLELIEQLAKKIVSSNKVQESQDLFRKTVETLGQNGIFDENTCPRLYQLFNEAFTEYYEQRFAQTPPTLLHL